MELIKLLPDYYDKNVTMKVLQGILSSETDYLEARLSETISNCFIQTASTMLSRYEKIFGIEINISKSDMFRRERITAKISGHGVTTKSMIMDVASRYSNGDVEVIEDCAKNSFLIKFVGTRGIPGNMGDLKLTIEEIKPAHLAVTYEYVYNLWGEISGLTWQEASLFSWEEIRTVNMNERN